MSGSNVEVLDYLRAQFARVDGRFDQIDRVLTQHGDRLSVLETASAATRRDLAELFGQMILVGHRRDTLSDWTDRIERRLILVEAP